MNTQTLLEARNLSFHVADKVLIKDISLSIQQHEMVVIIGPNGAGKSSLLKLLTGFHSPTHGECLLEGLDLRKWQHNALAKKRAVMKQQSSLSFAFTVEDVVAMGRSPYGAEHKQQAIEEALAQTDCLELRQRDFRQLSGGEQQRVTIARAIAKKPKLLLCDEPTGALDYETGKQILTILQNTARETGTTVLIITHNSAIAEMADRVIRINDAKVREMTVNDQPKLVAEIEW